MEILSKQNLFWKPTSTWQIRWNWLWLHTRNHQKLKLLPFIFYLLIFNKIVSMNLVAKNSAQRKLLESWKWRGKLLVHVCTQTDTLKILSIVNSFNVMSWIRLVFFFWTSQPHFIYLVHSRAGLQSKLCSPYCTEDSL